MPDHHYRKYKQNEQEEDGTGEETEDRGDVVQEVVDRRVGRRVRVRNSIGKTIARDTFTRSITIITAGTRRRIPRRTGIRRRPRSSRERRAHARLARRSSRVRDEGVQGVSSDGRVDPEYHPGLTVRRCIGGFAELTTVGPDGGRRVVHCDGEGGGLGFEEGGIADGGAIKPDEMTCC